MVGSRVDYPDLATEAARTVMLELVRILGEYKDSMAIVGGWVPELLFANAQPKHVGPLIDIRDLSACLFGGHKGRCAPHSGQTGLFVC